MAEIQNLKISNVETLEIRLTTGRKKYFFTEVSDLLKGKKIVDIVVCEQTAKTPSGNEAYTGGNCFLTLSISGKEKIKDYPSSLLSPNVTQIRPSFNDLLPEWSKSYINVLGDIVDGQSLVMCVMFND